MHRNTVGVILFIIYLLPLSLEAGQLHKELAAQSNLQMFVSGEQVSLRESLDKVEKKFNVNILFRTHQVRNKYVSKRNIFSDSLALELEVLLEPLNMSFEQINTKNYIIIDEDEPALVESIQETVTGQVTDVQSGETLPGVNIMIKGTTIGTSTDGEGRYSLNVPSLNDTLIVSFIGYQTMEIPINGRTEISINMITEAISGEEIVVVGYGEQKKESMVGAIGQATNEDLRRAGNSTDLRESLVGQVPGMVALTSSGEPGGVLTGESATDMFIRGQNTWNGGQPLILVDGVERDMNNIDVSEVESISVLKDASATAVYGVKGANGVILVNTKRGEEGRTTLNFNYTTNGKMLSKQPDKLDSYAAMMAKNEIIEREGVLNEPSWGAYVPYEIVQRYRQPQSGEYAEIYPNVDWEDAMFKDIGFSHRLTLNAQGGSETIQYFGSLAYTHEGDMFEDYDNYKSYDPNYNFSRFNFRSNIDAAITKTTNLQLNLSGFYSLKNTNFNNEGSTSRADHWMWRATYGLAPNLFLPMYDDGRWGAYQEGGNNTVNPVAAIYNIGIRETRRTQLNADFRVEQELDFIIQGLNVNASLFYDNTIRSEGGVYDRQNSIRPSEARTNVPFKQIYPMRYEGPDQDPSEYTELLPKGDEEYDWVLKPWSIRQEEITDANWTSYIPVTRRLMYQLQLNYTNTFGRHDVSAMGLFKREEYASGSMFKNYREDWVFRGTYNYDGRYLFEVNGAYNGSEQFGPDYRFDFFPSVAVGWNISNEDFFNIDWVNNLKVRYSIGKVGDDQVSGNRWLYESQLASGGNARLNSSIWGTSPYTFYRESVVGNPNIHWENAIKNNVGVDIGLFQNSVSLNVDYFTEDRTDIFIAGGSRSVPSFFGSTPPSANLGHVKSRGFEVELGLNKQINNNLNVWTNFTVSHNENEVIERDDPPLEYDYLKSAGYPIGQQRRLVRTEYYDNWDEVYASVPTETNDAQKLPGYYDLIDFNADGIIKNSEDTPPVGYSEIPQNTGTVTVGADYRGLSLMVQFYGANNANRYIGFNNFQNDTDIVYGHVEDYWSKDNPDASSFLPRWQTQAENIGDYYLYDASYVRLQSAEIAYSFNHLQWVRDTGVSNLRVFLNGNNLFFWSSLPDDRTTTYSGGSATQGAYPTVRRISLGIDLTF